MEELKKRLVITVSGLHGTGKSTQAEKLAEDLELRYLSAGMVFREMAEERCISLEEMSKLAELDSTIDRSIDQRTKEEALKGGVVVDASLSGWMVANADIKILLTASLETRINRIRIRDEITLEEAREATLIRERIERERFKNYYGIDINEISIYDVVLNTDLFDIEGTTKILKKIVQEYRTKS